MFALQKIRMFKSRLSFSLAASALLISALASTAAAQQPAAGSRFDVTNYRIEAQLSPDEHTLRAGADITFVPADATRSAVFELIGDRKSQRLNSSHRQIPYAVLCLKQTLTGSA